MAGFISYVEETAFPSGAIKRSPVSFRKLLNYLFEEELNLLYQLNYSEKLTIPQNNPVLFYPGCGPDILYPLFFVQYLLPSVNKITLEFVDKRDCSGLIKSILKNIGVPFTTHKQTTTFYWQDILVTMNFTLADVFSMDLPFFDIYFERKLAIFKTIHDDYEPKIMVQLNPSGIIISDSGFLQFNLKTISVPTELSVYKQMTIGKKVT